MVSAGSMPNLVKSTEPVSLDGKFSDSISKIKTFEFALAIIASFASLVLVGSFCASWWHVGAITSFSQLTALTLLSIGSLLWMTVVVVSLCSFAKNTHPPLLSTDRRDVKPEEAQNDSSRYTIFGKEAWEQLGVELVDDISLTPQFDVKDPFFNGVLCNYDLCFFPKMIQIDGIKMPLNLESVERIAKKNNRLIQYKETEKESIKAFFKQNSLHPGWRFISKNIPSTASKDFQTQIGDVENKHPFKVLSLLEAAFWSLLVKRSDIRPEVFMRCRDTIEDKYVITLRQEDQKIFICKSLKILASPNSYTSAVYQPNPI